MLLLQEDMSNKRMSGAVRAMLAVETLAAPARVPIEGIGMLLSLRMLSLATPVIRSATGPGTVAA